MTVILSVRQRFLSRAVTGQGLSWHCCRLSAPVILPHFRSCVFTLTQDLPCLVTMPNSLLCLVCPFMPVPHRRHLPESGALHISLAPCPFPPWALPSPIFPFHDPPWEINLPFTWSYKTYPDDHSTPCLLRASIYLCSPCCMHWAIFL